MEGPGSATIKKRSPSQVPRGRETSPKQKPQKLHVNNSRKTSSLFPNRGS